MGIYKANRYGDQILQIVQRFAPEPDTPKANKPRKKSAGPARVSKAGGFQAYKNKVVAKGSTEAYQPWTEKEDELLVREQKEGKTIKEMSEIHKRTHGAIRSRLKKLELT